MKAKKKLKCLEDAFRRINSQLDRIVALEKVVETTDARLRDMTQSILRAHAATELSASRVKLIDAAVAAAKAEERIRIADIAAGINVKNGPNFFNLDLAARMEISRWLRHGAP